MVLAKSKPASIQGVTLQGDLDAMVPIMGLSQPTALDYDTENKTIIYSDIQQSVIKRAMLNGSEDSVIVHVGIEKCEGLAYDWMARNLYWTDEALGRISVLRLSNPKYTRTIIEKSNIHPRSITINPKKGIMYWADWSHVSPVNGSIQRAGMDGSNQEIFLQNDIDWPTGLTLDLVGKRLYWCDAHLKKIESVDFDGNNRKLILSENVNRPFGLAMYNRSLYYIEYVLGNVMVFHPHNNTIQKLLAGNPPIFDIKVFDFKSQTGKYQTYYT